MFSLIPDHHPGSRCSPSVSTTFPPIFHSPLQRVAEGPLPSSAALPAAKSSNAEVGTEASEANRLPSVDTSGERDKVNLFCFTLFLLLTRLWQSHNSVAVNIRTIWSRDPITAIVYPNLDCNQVILDAIETSFGTTQTLAVYHQTSEGYHLLQNSRAVGRWLLYVGSATVPECWAVPFDYDTANLSNDMESVSRPCSTQSLRSMKKSEQEWVGRRGLDTRGSSLLVSPQQLYVNFALFTHASPSVL